MSVTHQAIRQRSDKFSKTQITGSTSASAGLRCKINGMARSRTSRHGRITYDKRTPIKNLYNVTGWKRFLFSFFPFAWRERDTPLSYACNIGVLVRQGAMCPTGWEPTLVLAVPRLLAFSIHSCYLDWLATMSGNNSKGIYWNQHRNRKACPNLLLVSYYNT